MATKELVFKSGDNYENWKMKMTEVLASKGMFGLDKKYAEWKKENPIKARQHSKEDDLTDLYDAEQKQALYMLYRYLDGDVLMKVQEQQTYKEAIKKLDGIYLKKRRYQHYLGHS